MSDLAALLAGLSPAEQAQLRASIASGGAGNGGSFSDLLNYAGSLGGFAPQPGQGGPQQLFPQQPANVNQTTAISVGPQANNVPLTPVGGSGGEPLPEPGSREESWYVLKNALPGMAQGFTRLRRDATLGETINAGLGGLLQGMGGVKAGLRQERREERQDARQTLADALEMDKLKRQRERDVRVQEMVAALPKEQQSAAMMNPDVFFGEQAESFFREPPKPSTPFGNEALGYFRDGPGGLEQIVKGLGRAPAAPREAPETWNSLSPAETAAMGFAPGTVVTRSSRGQIQVEQQAKGGGIQITGYDDAGRPLIEIGGPGGGATAHGSLTGPTRNEVQKETIGLQDQIAQLDQIAGGFKPEYLQLGPRLGNAVTAGKDKLGIGTSPEEQAALGNFAKFRSDSVANLNAQLKAQSGSAVTPQEAERTLSTIPNAGTGITDGDSPIEFKSKLNATVSRAKLALARKTYLQTQGIPFDMSKGNNGGVEIDAMPGIIDAEGAKVEQELVAKGVPPDQIEAQTDAILKQKFGI
jgi:hypothetical protein